MANLLEIQLDEVESAAAYYRNLAVHRHEILEGIRQLAFRNMQHLNDAMLRAGPRPSVDSDSAAARAWVRRIQTITLADQGVKYSELNQFLLELATFSPVRLYFSLLYAEIENFNKCSAKIPLMGDQVLTGLLTSWSSDLNTFGNFRHKFIHPESQTASAEKNLLFSGLQNRMPQLQSEFDQGLSRVRANIGSHLFAMFRGLPPAQQCYLLRQFPNISPASWLHAAFPFSQQQRTCEADSLKETIEAVSDADILWEPRSDEALVAKRMADLVSHLMPFVPFEPLPQISPPQPPLFPHRIAPFHTEGGQTKLSRGSAIRKITSNIGHYKRTLMVVAVLCNELEYAQTARVDKTPDTYQQMILAALPKVAFALLSNLLRQYKDITPRNTWATVPELDKLLEDSTVYNAFLHSRNSVFHVPELGQDPYQADESALKHDAPELLASLYGGLCRFLALISPSTPTSCPIR